MKRIIILIISVMTVASCSYLDAAREEMNERGVECRYNRRGRVENCRYMN
nr:hypothetical protein [uncultured Leptotrichia sp.]